jgi:hypothetical protein
MSADVIAFPSLTLNATQRGMIRHMVETTRFLMQRQAKHAARYVADLALYERLLSSREVNASDIDLFLQEIGTIGYAKWHGDPRAVWPV